MEKCSGKSKFKKYLYIYFAIQNSQFLGKQFFYAFSHFGRIFFLVVAYVTLKLLETVEASQKHVKLSVNSNVIYSKL